jgi:CPA2 family monovalent cation:H+ antiporter-2
MEHTDFLRGLIILYGMAMLIAYVMRHARQPTIVGYLLTGVVAGPHGLKLISETGAVEVLAEVGVALLLFTIGLELSLSKLYRMKELVLGAGTLQLGATVLACCGLLVWWGLAVRESLFWGFLVSASSTAIVIKLLHERRELDTVHGRIILGILLFQDLSVVPMMALLPALAAPGASQALSILVALGKSLLIVALILGGAHFLFPWLLRAIVGLRSRELFIIATVFFALGTSWGAAQLGLSLALGAFLAGIVLSESEYGHQIMADILPFRDSFNSLFFITIGMLIDLRFVRDNALLLAGITLGILAGKMLAGGAAVRLLGFPPRMAALVGLGIAQVGEFSFVLLREGSRLQMIPEHRYQLFLAAAVLTMMATPSLMMAAPRISQWFGGRGPRRDVLAPDEKTEQLRDHVIICGYGLNGRRLARLMKENGVPYVVIEMDARRVRASRAEGESIYYGDIGNSEILKAAGARQARAVVFAVSDPTILARAISHARMLNPDIHIIARIKRIQDARDLREAGATDVIAEELEAWMEIAVRVMRVYGMPREVVAHQISQLREGDYEMLRVLPLPGQPLRHLTHLLPQVDVELFHVLPGAPLVGVELRDLDLRARTGVMVLAVVRGEQVIHNPPPDFAFAAGDQLLLIGARDQITTAYELLQSPGVASPRPN